MIFLRNINQMLGIIGIFKMTNIKQKISEVEIERIKKEQFKEICEGYDISESELKAECIIDVEECIENSIKKTLKFCEEEFLEIIRNEINSCQDNKTPGRLALARLIIKLKKENTK